MGAWGVKLYEDDVTCDIKEEYITLLKEKKDNIETTKRIINNNEEFIQDEDDAPLFWFALADIQWRYGRLLPEIKEQALKHLSEGKNLERWKEENPKLYNKRKEILDNLRTQLESEQPPEKKIIIKKPFITDWKDGDLFAWKLESDYAKERALEGRYLLFYKIGEKDWINDSIVPIIYAKITLNNKIPKSIEEINSAEYISVGYETSPDFYKLSYDQQKETMYNSDHSYSLKEYRCYLDCIPKRSISKKLIYLGNYLDIELPKVDLNKLPSEVTTLEAWKFLEERFIHSYLIINKKLGYDHDENFRYVLDKNNPGYYCIENYDEMMKKYDKEGILKKEYYDEKTFIRK